MNVRMPNGTMIKNVPTGTTKEALATKLNNSSVFTGEKIDVALFAGKGAKTFPVIKAKKQEELIKSGATETDAFIETGVFNKVDAQSGKVIPEFNPQRFEIDDSKSTFISDSVWSMDDDESEKVQLSLGDIGTYKGDDIGSMRPKIERRGGGFANTPITYEQAGLEQNIAVSTLGKLLKHDDFFKAYPEFKDLRIELTTSDVNVVGEENMDNVDIQEIDGFMGAFYPSTSTRPGKIVMNMKYFKGGTADEIKKTLIHEIQHLIDDKEMTKDESLSPYTGANEQKDKYPYLKERRFPESSVTKEAWSRESAFRMKLDKDERRKFVPFGLESRDDKINENKIDQIKRIKKHQETLPGYPERDKVSKESHKDFRQEIDKFEVEMDEEMKERRELENDPLYKKPARNIRNNNLGNIKMTNENWDGSISNSKEKTFVTFKTPEYGVRALNKVIDANLKATNSYETYVNRYASEPKEQAYFKKHGRLMPHLVNYAKTLATSQGIDLSNSNWIKQKPKSINKLEWIKATATAEGGKGALTYFTDKVINGGLQLP